MCSLPPESQCPLLLDTVFRDAPRHAWCLPAPAWGPPAFSSFIFLTVAPTPVHISEQSQLGLACFPTWKRELRWPASILFSVGSQSPEGGSVHLLGAEGGGRSAAPRAQALLGKGVVRGSGLPSPGLPSAGPQLSSSSSFTGNERFGFAIGLVPGCRLGLLAR